MGRIRKNMMKKVERVLLNRGSEIFAISDRERVGGSL